jgi:transposase-like protein
MSDKHNTLFLDIIPGFGILLAKCAQTKTGFMTMSYRTIDAQQKVDAVKSFWAHEKIARIAKNLGTSRATIYAWIALAEEAMKAAFEQTQPGPCGKTLQEENAALRDELQKVYYVYHQSSHLESASDAGAEAPSVCATCGSAQIRKNGTLSSERQGLRQRYSCRQCSWSVYVVLKKTTA